MGLRLVFLTSKDPTFDHGGDVALTNVAMSVAEELGHEVHCICLSKHAAERDSTPEVTRLPKPPVSALELARRSVRNGRSLIHNRYDTDAMVAAINEHPDEPDLFVAEHSYMAEPFLRSRRAGQARLLVNTQNPESAVWAQRHGLVGKLDARRIETDESRVFRAAHSVATYDRDEVPDLKRRGASDVAWLDLTMRPAVPVAVRDTPPRLLFVGWGNWPPNRQAARLIRECWPSIRRGIEGAELWIVGGEGTSSGTVPDESVKEFGFVPDLDAVMDQCRALAAPIITGGGVRVKILHATSRGLPVVTTSAGLGSLDEIFGIAPHDDQSQFIARCRELLQSPEAASEEGARSYAANEAHWAKGRPVSALTEWWKA